MYLAAFVALLACEESGSNFVPFIVAGNVGGNRPEYTARRSLRCLANVVGELCRSEAAPRRKQRNGIEKICFPRSVGSRENNSAAAQSEFGLNIGPKIG